MMTVQAEQLPVPGWPHRWWLNLVGWLVRRANSAGARRVLAWDFWTIKDAVLRRWGRRDGWDLQVFRCEDCSPDCYRCGGTGIHRAVKLERWRLSDPATLEGAWAAPWIWSRGNGLETRRLPRKIYQDRIRHPRRRGSELAAAALVFALRWRPWMAGGLTMEMSVQLNDGSVCDVWKEPPPPFWQRWPWGWLPYALGLARDAFVRWAVREFAKVIDLGFALASSGRGHRIVRPSEPFYVNQRCPECDAQLVAEINDRHADGTWEPGGVRCWCSGEEETGHRYDLWIETTAAVDRWCRDHVRVHEHLAERSDAPAEALPF